MADLDKLSIESWENWFTLKISEKTEITDKELVSMLTEQDFSRIQELQLAKKKEQYEKLKPAGFEYAPTSANEKWEELKNTDNVETMKRIHNNISYNSDYTMNILELKKTFCEDISWQNEKFNFVQAQELSKQTWYTLMTHHNNTDTEEEKIQTDWYQVINIFSQGNGDTPEWMVMFRDMAWCNNTYWTATPYKNENWKEVKGSVREVLLYKEGLGRVRAYTYHINRVCGLKDSM